MAAKKCLICNSAFAGRADAKTCSPRCRKRLQQVRFELSSPSTDRSRLRKAAILILLGLFGFLSILFTSYGPKVQAATSSNLNFQARLLNSAGGIVPDGNYNIDFKIYSADSTTGSVGTCTSTCLWEETRTNFASHGVQVINGYFSVNLGSVTSFPSTINWDQQLFLTMNIGGTTTGASPTWDGEMQNAGHSIALTALPYAFVAGQLAVTSGANRGTLSFNTVATNPVITLPDASGTVCLQNAVACGFEVGSTGTDFIRNQITTQSNANFNIQSAAAVDIGGVITGASGQSVDILQIKANAVTAPLFNIGSAGAATFHVSNAANTVTASGNEITDATRTTNTQGDGRAAPDSSYGLWEATTNQVTNGGFESNATGWTTWGNPSTITQTTSQHYFGSGAAQVVTPGNFTQEGMQMTTAATASAGQVWTASAWVKGTAGATLKIRVSDVTVGSGDTNFTATGAWQKVSVTYTIGTGATQAKAILGTNGTLATTFFADGLQLEQKSAATPYVETNGATASRSAASITTPITGLNTTQGWVSARVRLGFANGGAPNAFPTVYRWADDATHRIIIYYDNTNNNFKIERDNVTGSTAASAALGSFPAGTTFTIVGSWDASTVKLSVNGVTFVSTANTTIPTLAATTTNIGYNGAGTNLADSDFLWLATGSGTLTSTDSSTINARGNDDPDMNFFTTTDSSSAPVMAWKANSAGYQDTPPFQIQNSSGLSLLTVDSADNQVLIPNATSSSTALVIGGDADLYRSAANTLKTDGNFTTAGILTVSGNANLFKNTVDSTTSTQFQTAAGTAVLDIDTINGRIGIGKNNPTQTLDVAGNITNGTNTIITGNLSASTAIGISTPSVTTGYFSKVATVDTGGVTVNDVVVTNSNARVVDTTTARDTRVYGVATTTQATAGSNTNVAIGGDFQVTADTGAVAVGDQLVTSTTSGQVTTDNNATTGILGTALSSKASGSSGLVSVAINPVGGQSTPRFQNISDSTTAFQVQNVAGNNYILVNTSGASVAVGNTGIASTVQIGNATGSAVSQTINVGTNGTSGATNVVHIGDGASSVNTITEGSTNSTSTLTLQAGTGTATGDINIQTASGGIINIGTSAVTNKVLNLGTVGNTVNASTVHIADTNANATQSVTIGNTTSANNVILIQGGTSSTAIQLQAGSGGTIALGTTNNNNVNINTAAVAGTTTVGGTATTGTITLGQSTATNTINIGTAAGNSNTQTINIGTSSTAGSTSTLNIGSTVAGITTLQSQGGIKVSTIGSATGSSVYLCRDTSTALLTACSTGSGVAFVQGGNSFSAPAVLGTNDSNSLSFETNGATQATIAVGGATTFKNSTNSTGAFQVQNTAGVQLLNIDTSTTPNLISNGGFEVNTTGWAARGSDAISRVTTNQFEGNASLQIITTNTSLDGASFPVTLSPSTAYTLSMWVKGSSAYTNAFNLGRQDVSGTDVFCSNFSVTTAWSRVTCSFTTGGTITSSNIFISQNSATIRTIFIDGVQLQTGATATAYQNGLIQLNGVINSPTVFRNAQDSSGAFQIQNAASTSIFNVDTNGSQVTISGGLTVTGAGNITANNNINVGNALSFGSSLTAGAISKNYTAGGTNANFDVLVMNSSGQVVTTTTPHDPRIIGVAGGAATVGVVEGVTVYGNWTVNADIGAVAIGDQLVTSSTAGAVTVDNNATSGILGYATSAKAGGSAGTVSARILIVSGQSTPKFQNTSDSTTAFQIQNAAGNSNLLIADTTDSKIAIGAAVNTTGTTLQVTGNISSTTGIFDNTKFVINNSSATGGRISKNATVGTGGVTANDVVVLNSSDQVVDTTTARDTRVYGVATATATSGNGVEVAIGGNTTVTYDTGGPTPAIGDQLVTSATSGKVTVDNNATTGILGTATTAGSGGNVGVAINIYKGEYSPVFRNATDSTTAFQIQNAAGSTNLFTVDTQHSEVGIGGAPAGSGAALQVAGSASVTGSFQIANTSLSGGNIAKNVTAGGTVTAGDAVVFNSSGNVIDSTQARDVKVAGVASNSTTVGNTVALIISGNTQVTADGAVAIGDQLVLNGTAGHVSANNSATSGIIGIAMSTQASGSGLVSIFVRPVNGEFSPVLQNATDSTTAFQIQNAAGNVFVTADSTNKQLILGKASTIDGGLQFLSASGTGSISIIPANPGSTAYTITLPAETGTICTTAMSAACITAYGGGGGTYVNFAPSTVQADTTTNNSIFINKTGASGNILDLQSGGNDVFTIGNTGGLTSTGTATFQNATNSNTAFQIQNSAGSNLFLADTTNPNLITNPSFEAGAGAWAINTGSGSVARDTSQKIVGNASGAVATSATANAGVKIPVSLSASTTYFLSFYAKIASGSFTIQAGRSDAGTFAGETTCSVVSANPTSVNTVSTDWYRYNCSFTTGGSVSSPYIFIRQSDSTARTFYIDAIQLQTGAASAYKEGSVQINGTVSSPLVVQNQANSTSAFSVLTAAGSTVFNVDTINGTIGTTSTNNTSINSAVVSLRSGNAYGATSSSGNVNIDVGTATGSAGNIDIGTINASSGINIGATGSSTLGTTTNIANTTDGTGTQTVNIGSNANANSNVNIKSGATGGINIGAVGSLTSPTTVHIGDTSNGSGIQSISIGSTANASNVVTLQGGTGSTAISIQAAASGTIALGTANNNNINVNTAAVAGTTTIGGTATTGTITLGQSAATNTISIGGAAGNGATQTVNIGNSTTTGSTTNLVLGSTIAGTTTLQSAGGTIINTSAGQALTINGVTGTATINVNNSGAVTDTGAITFTGQRASFGYDGSSSNAYVYAAAGKGINLKTNGGTVALNLASSGAATFQNGTNSTTAFQIQNVANASLLTVDTLNTKINTGGDLNVGTNYGSRLFSDDFESGNFNLWGSGNSGITIDSSIVHNGKYSAKLTMTGTAKDVVAPLSGGASTIDYRAYVNLTSISTIGGLISIGTSTSEFYGTYLDATSHVCFWNAHTSTGTCSSQVVPTGSWHLIDTLLTQNGAAGSFVVTYDGTVVINQTGQSTGTGTYNNLILGETVTSRTETVNFDDVSVDTTATGPAASLNVSDTLHVAGSSSFGGSVLIQPGSNSTSAFQIQNSAGTSNLFVADTVNGKIGIGGAPTSTGSTLQVTGSILTSSFIQSNSSISVCTGPSGCYFGKGFDVGTGGVNINDVVVLANDSGNQRVIDSTTARDSRVWGVSTATATSGQTATIAIAGNYVVNVDTGAVAIGDQLVVSGTSGQATVDNNATTGIVGRALSSKAGGSAGTVNVAIRPVGGVSTPKFQNTTDSATSLQIQNASGSDLFNANTSDGYVINNGTEGLDNQIQNAGFEALGTTDSSGWFTPSATQVLTNDSTNAHSGNRELQITGNSSTHAVSTKWYAIKPGDTIYTEAWVKNSAGATGDAGIYLEFADKDKGGSTFVNADTGLPGTSYILKSLTSTAGAGKDYVRVVASVKATATAGTFYFDDFYMKRTNQQAPLLLTNGGATAFQVQNSSAVTVLGVDGTTNKLFSSIADGATAVGFSLNTSNSYTTSGAKLLSVQNSGAEKFSIDKDGNVAATGNISIATGKTYQINGTQITSAALSNDSNLAKLNGTGPQTFTGDNKFSSTLLVQSTSTTSFQVQNASNSILTVDGTGNKVILGAGGAGTLTANLQFNFTGQTGSIALVPLNPSSTNYTLNLPAENGTLCTSAASSNANCTNFASSSSLTSGLSGKLNKGTVDTSSAAVTALQGDLYAFSNTSSNIASGVLKLDNGNNTDNALYVTGTTDYSTGKAYILVNNTNAGPSGNLIDLQSNAVDEFTVDASGNVTAAGNISIATGKLYEINGVQISTAALSDGAQVAKLNATQTFTGANTFSNAGNAFTGDGSALTNLNATNIATGTLNDGRLSTNVALLNGTQTFTGANTFAPTGNNAGQLVKQTSGTATSGSVLDVQTANGTSHFLQITNAAANEGAVTLQSVGATRDLTLNSGSGTIKIPSSTTGIQNTGSTSFSIDVQNGSNSTLFITNSSTGLASLDVEGGINIASGQTYKINNSQITSAALSNDSDIAKLSGTGPQIFTGNNKFTGTVLLKSSSASAFQIQQTATSTNLFAVDTAANTVSVGAPTIFNGGTYSSGTSATITGSLIDNNTTVQVQATTSGLTFTMPTPTVQTLGRLAYITNTGANALLLNYGTGTVTLAVNGTITLLWNGGNWTGAGSDASNLQNNYTNSTGGTTPEILLDSTRNGLDVQDANTSLTGQSLFTVRSNATATTLGASLFNILANGHVGINIGSTATNPTVSNDLSFGVIAGVTTSRTIGVETQTTTNIGGNGISVQAGAGNGTGNGGASLLQGGTSGTGAAATGGAVNIFGGTAAGTGASNGGNVTISGGTKSGTGAGGSVIIKAQASNDTTTTFQVQNGAGTSIVLDADTANSRVGIGTNAPDKILTIAPPSNATATLGIKSSGGAGSEIDFGQAGTYSSAIGYNRSTSGMLEFTVAGTSFGPIGSGNTVFSLSNVGSAVFQNNTNTSTAFQIQNAAGTTVMNTNTTTGDITTNLGNLKINGVTLTAAPTIAGSGSGGNLPAATYSYMVAAIGPDGEGFDYPATTTYVATGTTSSVVVSWTAVTGASGYKVYRSNDGGATWKVQTLGVVASYSDTNNALWTTTGTRQDFSQSGNIDLQYGAGVIFNAAASTFIQNSATINSLEIGNFISGAGVSTVSDNFNVYDLTGTNKNLSIDSNGAATFKNKTNTTAGFSIKNSGNTTLFGINTTNNLATVNAGTIFASNTYSSGSTSTITQATIDNNTTVMAAATAGGLTFTVPSPSITTSGRLLYVTNDGANSFTISYGSGSFTLNVNSTVTLLWNGTAWTTAGADAGTLQTAYNNASSGSVPDIKVDGTHGALNIQDNDTPITGDILDVNASAIGAIGTTLFGINGSGQTRFRTTTDSATAFQLQNSNGASALTLDDTNSANGTNLALNSGCEAGTTTCTSWAAFGTGTATRDTGAGNFISGAAGGKIVTTATNSGYKITTSSTLSQSTTYLISFTIKNTSGPFSDLAAAILYNGTNIDTGTGAVNSCGTTMTVSASFSKVSCSFTTGSSNTFTSSSALAVYETTTGRTFFLDNVSIIAQVSTNADTVSQLKVGGASGQGLTLFTVDSFAGRPSTNTTPNTALLGSMYYDTTLGKMQCYEASGWGYCGASPDVSVNLVPEYQGLVLHGTGIGTLTSDFCANTTSGGGFNGANAVNATTGDQTCANTGEIFNYYKWTSPQATNQTYSMYVRYQLPATFKNFSDQNTITLTARTTNTTNASVAYTLYKPDGTLCGTATTVTSSNNTWQTVSLSGDETTCALAANNIMLFKIDVTASNGASAYVSNLSFLTKGQ